MLFLAPHLVSPTTWNRTSPPLSRPQFSRQRGGNHVICGRVPFQSTLLIVPTWGLIHRLEGLEQHSLSQGINHRMRRSNRTSRVIYSIHLYRGRILCFKECMKSTKCSSHWPFGLKLPHVTGASSRTLGSRPFPVVPQLRSNANNPTAAPSLSEEFSSFLASGLRASSFE